MNSDNGFALKSLAYAIYWSNYATSDANHARTVTRGDGHVLTPLELEQDAFRTALQHIYNIDQVVVYAKSKTV